MRRRCDSRRDALSVGVGERVRILSETRGGGSVPVMYMNRLRQLAAYLPLASDSQPPRDLSHAHTAPRSRWRRRC